MVGGGSVDVDDDEESRWAAVSRVGDVSPSSDAPDKTTTIDSLPNAASGDADLRVDATVEVVGGGRLDEDVLRRRRRFCLWGVKREKEPLAAPIVSSGQDKSVVSCQMIESNKQKG